MTAAEEFAQALFDKLAKVREGGPLSAERWKAIVAEHYQAAASAPKKKRVKGERNPLIDALAAAVGLDVSQIAPMRWRRLGVALADIRAAMPDVTPEEIRRRVTAYKTKHRDWQLTETSLAMHWSELGGGPKTRSEKLNPYAEPEPHWRIVAKSKYPNALEWMAPHDFERMAWADVSMTLRTDILKAMTA